MQPHMEKPALPTRAVPVTDLAGASIEPEYALAALRAQYLAEIFALPASTAVTVAELAFGEVAR